MDKVDNPIYVIYEINDGNYYIEDIEKNCTYSFQDYNEIIDKSRAPKRFKLDNFVTVKKHPQCSGRVYIYECITNSAPHESKVGNSYCWNTNTVISEETSAQLNTQKSFCAANIEEGGYSFLNEHILESIWTKMKWKKSE